MGLQHALGADHVAAVSALAGRGLAPARAMALGATWGVGHMLTLLVVAGFALFSGFAPGHELALWLELGVGIMLLILGGHVIYRVVRDRVHFHAHAHSKRVRHIHAHSHADEKIPHRAARHVHDHRKSVSVKALLVGIMHGLAGSAALLVLAVANAQSPLAGLGYVLIFGLGSVLGMAALSLVISIPLTLSARFLTWGNWTLQGAVGIGTAVFGIWIVGYRWTEIAGL
jgi:ABC-type nickel/cobalt efflux system permease component RcnA